MAQGPAAITLGLMTAERAQRGIQVVDAKPFEIRASSKVRGCEAQMCRTASILPEPVSLLLRVYQKKGVIRREPTDCSALVEMTRCSAATDSAPPRVGPGFGLGAASARGECEVVREACRHSAQPAEAGWAAD